MTSYFVSSVFSFCAQILSTSDLLHAAPNLAKCTDSIYSRRIAGFPWCRYSSVAVNHKTLGRRGTKKHRSWQCLCVVSLYIYRHGLKTGDVDSLDRQGGTWSEYRAYRARYGTLVC